MGTDEFSKNLQNIRDGLSRSRENTMLRERLQNMSDDEVRAALKDLERREKEKKRQETLGDKLKDELQ